MERRARGKKGIGHRIAVATVTVVVLCIFLSAPRPGSAQLSGIPIPAGGIPVSIVGDLPTVQEMVLNAMKDNFGFQLQLALINMGQTFLQNAAYETAVWVASGAPGQWPLIEDRPEGQLWKDLALGAGVQFLDELDKNAISPNIQGIVGGGDDFWKFPGELGLAQFACAPNPSIGLKIKLGLADRLHSKPPLCTWKQFSENWENFAKTETLVGALNGIGLAFEPGQSDISLALDAHVALTSAINVDPSRKVNEVVQSGFLKPLQEQISERTKTPAKLVEDQLVQSVQSGKQGSRDVQQAARDALGNTDTFFPMLAQAGQALGINFAQTLIAQTIQKQVIEKGIILGIGDLFKKDPETAVASSASPLTGRAAVAQQVFAELKRPRFTTGGSYDALGLFSSCDRENRQLNTCVMDSGFAQAVRQAQNGNALTVAEALATNALHGDWSFYPAGSVRDQDPGCSQEAYCASNLAKLRLARVIPVGWEMLANHSDNTEGNRATLNIAIREFNKNGDDAKCGTHDNNESPYCGLIDPNWVLRYPSQQCRLRAPTELLLQAGTNFRAEECRDAESCLAEDGEGRCVGASDQGGPQYGYCVREENVWRLRGDACPAYAASCRVLTRRTGGQLNVLTSTVDSRSCSAGNAGCLWYATARDASGNWDATRDRRYFNKNVSVCDSKDGGCTELVPAATSRLNVITNGGFERDDDGNRIPDGWAQQQTTIGAYDASGAQSLEGSAAVQLGYNGGGGAWRQDGISVIPGQWYTISASAKRSSQNVARRLRVSVTFFSNATALIPSNVVPAIDSTVESSNCNVGVNGSTIELRSPVDAQQVPSAPSASYERFSCSFTVPAGAAVGQVHLMSDNPPDQRVADTNALWLDAVQLEIGRDASSYHEGYGTNATRAHLKVAPQDLRCDDLDASGHLNTANDDARCPAFARACTVDEVGCERYTPTDGTPAVNGRVTEIDRCPAECVGYAAYQEVDSAFDRKSTLDYFIPTTAQQCTAEQVGCAEFTNLDAVDRGGESRAAFSFLRRCVKPTDTNANANAETYYTWEGSDTGGYRIQRFTLQAATGVSDPPPQVMGNPPDANCGPNNAADTIDPTGADAYGQSPGPAPYDPIVTPDCRAFYTQAGTIYYRRLSQTIIVSDSCTRYRASHNPDATTCAAIGGAYGAQTGCVFQGLASESRQCSLSAVGCRAYRGNASGAVQTIAATDFEVQVNGQLHQGWRDLSGSSLWPISSESLLPGGHSLQLQYGQRASYLLHETRGGLTATECDGFHGTTRTGIGGALLCDIPLLTPGSTYEVMVIGRGAGLLTTELTTATLTRDASGNPQSRASVVVIGAASQSTTLTPLWQRVVLGPFFVPVATTLTDGVALDLVNGTGAQDAFIDQVLLRETPQLVTVIKSAWSTPQQCDRASIALSAAPQPQGMLGCKAYQNRANVRQTLRSFTRLCTPEVVGCTAFYDTKNSTSTTAKTFNDLGANDPSHADDVTIPGDAIRYLVDDPAKRCTAAVKGCREVGKPTLDRSGSAATGTATSWASTYLIDDPDRYTGAGATLCTEPALFCEEYHGTDGALAFFKDPGNRTCAYRQGVIVGNVQVDGWFREGIDPPVACDPNFVIGGGSYGIWKSSDTNYIGWAGTCAVAHDQCIEYRDPTDVNYQHPSGKLYYALRPTIDAKTCAGNVSRKEGCIALDDTTVTANTWSAAASYAESDQQLSAAVPVIDCDRNPASCRRCIQGNRCQRRDGTFVRSSARGVTCTTDTDCVAGDHCTGGGTATKTCATTANCDTANGFSCQVIANDTNTIVKVQRDRQCSQWYTRDSCVPVFDDRTGRQIDSCTGLLLHASSGKTIQRTGLEYLTRTAYQSRDRSFSGQEYSGFAIPGRPYLEQLREVVLASASGAAVPARRALVPVWCPANATATGAIGCGGSGQPACVCGPAEGQCPAYTPDNGDCGIPIGQNRCRKQQPACTQTRDSSNALLSNPDGTPTMTCVVPAQYGDFCQSNAECGSGETCAPVRGICYQSRCTYAPSATEDSQGRARLAVNVGINSTLNAVATSVEKEARISAWEPVACKAYPERDAPFPRDVHEGPLATPLDLGDPTPGANTSPTTNPQVSRAAFASVSLCRQQGSYSSANPYNPQTNANDGGLACECSYQKASYGGESGASIRYYAPSINGGVAPPAICVGGKYDGQGCELDTASVIDVERVLTDGTTRVSTKEGNPRTNLARTCIAGADPSANDGVCKSLTRSDPALGVDGYCLERDESLPLYGKSDRFACRTFFPVDQLQGSVDINNYVRTAGYNPTAGGRFMCVEAKGNAHLASSRSTAVPYPLPDSPYWVAARIESEYSRSSGEGEALFSNERNASPSQWYAVGGTSGLENHPWYGRMVHEDDRFAGDDSFIDRVQGAPENAFWSSRLATGIHRSEIESIRFAPARPVGGSQLFDDGLNQIAGGGFTTMSSFDLSDATAWTNCMKKDGNLQPGITLTDCWDLTNSSTNDLTQLTRSVIGNHRFHSGVCRGTTTSYLGAHAEFDANGFFLGLWTGYCNDPASDGSPSPTQDREFSGYDIYFRFREICTEVREVAPAVATIDVPGAKPWTDRVLGPNAYQISSGPRYDRATPILPFGSGTSGGTKPPTTIQSLTPTIAPNTWYVDMSAVNAPGIPQGAGAEHAGAPYACRQGQTCVVPTGIGTLPSSGASNSPGESLVHEVFANFTRGWRLRAVSATRQCSGGTLNGQPCLRDFDCQLFCSGSAGNQCCRTASPGGAISCSPANNLPICGSANNFCQNLNGRCVSVIVGGQGYGYDPISRPQSTSTQPSWDIATNTPNHPAFSQPVSHSSPTAPVVRSLAANGREGADPISVNGLSGPREVVRGLGGSLAATLQFFVEANPNQMPIRRVVVEWGDATSGYSPAAGSYTNFRGKGNTSSSNGGTWCDDTNFGQSKGACTDRPFSVTHTYVCTGPGLPLCSRQSSTGDIRPSTSQNQGCWDPSEPNPAGGPLGACVFIPRVHVKDNWGYCTGSCPGGNLLNSSVCYDERQLNPANPQQALSNRDNECRIQGDAGPQVPGAYPWASFAGRVVVHP